MKELNNIEFWENHYLNQIEYTIIQDLEKMMNGLKSKDKIKDDWIKAFLSTKNTKQQNSDFARGAERIYFWLFNQLGIPNSSPIGSDMFFETYNAFIHIDIKTAKLNNPSDYKGEVPVGANQSSYFLPNKNYTVNLPTKYSYKDKLCLTYFIQIIYNEKNEKFNIKAIYLISVPNGELNDIYKDKIYRASKNKGKGFRYKYSEMPKYELLKNKPFRIRRLYISNSIKEKDITTLSFK